MNKKLRDIDQWWINIYKHKLTNNSNVKFVWFRNHYKLVEIENEA
jgi:hypothetical protein